MTEQQAREEFIQGLRDLADLYENQPGLQLPHEQTINVFCDSAEEFTEQARALGSVQKRDDGRYFTLRRTFGGVINFDLFTERDLVCERIVTGQRVIPATEAKLVPAEPERIEDIIEWRCPDSVLRKEQSV